MAEKFESPKKKKKLSISRLKTLASSQEITLGSVQQKANKDPVEHGFIQDVKLQCALLDFRHGRLDMTTYPAFSFITLADATTSLSVGLSVKESGLKEMRLPEEARSDEALCYGMVELKGNISWAPSKQDSSVPTYIFSRGSISDLQISESFDGIPGKLFPTSDVLANLCRSRFFSTSKYTTKVVWGKLDAACLSETKNVVLSVEDPVGYVGIEVTEVSDNFLEERNLKESEPIVLVGPLRLKSLEEDTNPFLTVKASDVIVKKLAVATFRIWVSDVCSIPSNEFYGDPPELM